MWKKTSSRGGSGFTWEGEKLLWGSLWWTTGLYGGLGHVKSASWHEVNQADREDTLLNVTRWICVLQVEMALWFKPLLVYWHTSSIWGKKTLSELGFTRDPVFLQPWLFDTSPISRHGDVSYTRRQQRGRQLRKVAAVLRCQRQDLVDGEFWLQNQKTELNIITDHIVNKLWVMLVPPGILTTQGRGR